ncbi:hypothetical protein BGX26_011669 [Mortierella sp. AD094]|nr:hypothetical protein BGX26_011669 [Mortierella sp. AD094]
MMPSEDECEDDSEEENGDDDAAQVVDWRARPQEAVALAPSSKELYMRFLSAAALSGQRCSETYNPKKRTGISLQTTRDASSVERY